MMFYGVFLQSKGVLTKTLRGSAPNATSAPDRSLSIVPSPLAKNMFRRPWGRAHSSVTWHLYQRGRTLLCDTALLASNGGGGGGGYARECYERGERISKPVKLALRRSPL